MRASTTGPVPSMATPSSSPVIRKEREPASGPLAMTRADAAAKAAMAAQPLTHVVNGRFKGGWITRHYGRPAEHVHALQMEKALSAYLATEAAPWSFDAAIAAPLQSALSAIIEAALTAAAQHERSRS